MEFYCICISNQAGFSVEHSTVMFHKEPLTELQASRLGHHEDAADSWPLDTRNFQSS